MNNIKKYRPTNKLFEISLAYLVHNIPDIEDVRNINKVYMNFRHIYDINLEYNHPYLNICYHTNLEIIL